MCFAAWGAEGTSRHQGREVKQREDWQIKGGKVPGIRRAGAKKRQRVKSTRAKKGTFLEGLQKLKGGDSTTTEG